MSNYWLSFYATPDDMEAFEYHGPWWISGETDDGRLTIVLAVRSDSEQDAEKVASDAFDDGRRPKKLQIRFNDRKPDRWTPFCTRFRRATWMKWPWPKKAKR